MAATAFAPEDASFVGALEFCESEDTAFPFALTTLLDDADDTTVPVCEEPLPLSLLC